MEPISSVAYANRALLLDPAGNAVGPEIVTGGTRPDAVWFNGHFWVFSAGDGLRANRITPDGTALDGPVGRMITLGSFFPSHNAAVCGDKLLVAGTLASGAPWTVRGVLLDSIPEAPLNIAIYSVGQPPTPKPDITRLGDGFLLVWYAASPQSQLIHLMGARLDASGTLLDPDGFIIRGNAADMNRARVASIGHEALVVWAAATSIPTTILGARVDSAGTVLDTEPIRFTAGTTTFDRKPDVAANGGHYLVVWERMHGTIAHSVHGKYLGADQILDQHEFEIAPRAQTISMNPAVAGAEDGIGSFLVSWHSGYGEFQKGTEPAPQPDATISGRFIGAIEFPPSRPPLVIANTIGDQINPAVVFNGDRFAVAWHDTRNFGFDYGDIWGKTILTSGTQTTEHPHATGEAHQFNPALAASGSGFLLTWEELKDNFSGDSSIHGTYIRDDGVPSFFGTQFINTGPFTKNPAAAARGDRVAIVASEGPRSTAHQVLWNTLPAHEEPILRIDPFTAGSWKQSYGADGAAIAQDGISLPSGTSITFEGASAWTWTRSTTDSRALERINSSGRIASCWYAPETFTVHVSLPQPTTLALYLLDWDHAWRAQRVEIYSATSGALLHAGTFTDFLDGRYLVYELQGDLRIRISRGRGPNAILSGIFLGGPYVEPLPSTVSPVISPNGGTFEGPVQVSLSTSTSGASIHYSTDGTAPNTQSPLYTSPFTRDRNAIVRAIAVHPQMRTSSEAFAQFLIRAPSNAVQFIGENTTLGGTWKGAFGEGLQHQTVHSRPARLCHREFPGFQPMGLEGLNHRRSRPPKARSRH